MVVELNGIDWGYTVLGYNMECNHTHTVSQLAGKSSNFWVEIPASQVSSPEMFLFSAVWRFSAIQRWEA